MKISIGNRLFFATLLAMLAVMATGVEVARWSLLDTATHAPSGDREVLPALLDDLASRYREHGDWSFIPTADPMREDWIGEEWRRTNAAHAAASSVPPSITFGGRLGLLDAQRQRLSGYIAHPALVALASIDTVRRDVVVDGGTVGYLVVAGAQNPRDELTVAFLLHQQRNLLVIAAFALAVCALAAAVLAGHFRRPIRRLADGARRLEAGQLDTRVALRRGDELGDLADTFNRMAIRLDDAERSRRQWVADTSHELRTPLAVLRAQLEALQDGVRAGTPEQCASMLRQVAALSRLVDDLHDLARGDVGQLRYERRDVDVWILLTEVLNGFSERLGAANLTLSVGPAPARAMVDGDASRLRQVLANLIENSLRYTAAGGRIDVRAIAEGKMLAMRIDDSAPGVDAASIQNLGERFFRVDASRSRHAGGSGLGLALARQIVHAHSGELVFAHSALGGLCVTLTLPLDA